MDITKSNYTEIEKEILTYIKQYYPDVTDDFDDVNIMKMVVEMLAYVGDTLHYEQQMELSKLFIQGNYDYESLLKLGYLFGYKKFKKSSASTLIELSVDIPANLNNPPDGKLNEEYLNFIVQEGSEFESSTNPPVRFRLIEDINFGDKNSQNYTVVSNLDEQGIIQSYTVSKTGRVLAATYKSFAATITEDKPYYSIILPDTNIIGIESVNDITDNQTWYECNSFLQNNIFTISHDETYNRYTLNSLTSNKLFMTNYDSVNDEIKILFGGGEDTSNPNMNDYLVQFGDSWLSSNSDLYIKDIYGEKPIVGHVFAINYYINNGKSSSVPPNTIKNIKNLMLYKDASATSNLFSVVNSNLFSVTNNKSAVGGSNDVSIEFLQNNLEGFFSTQNRAVTLEDYSNILSIFPSKLGHIYKKLCLSENQQIYLWLLTVDGNNYFAELSDYMKTNMQLWLTKYRMIGDIVNLMTPHILNINVTVNATVNRKNAELHTDIIRNNIKNNLLEFLHNDKMQINQNIDILALSQYIYDKNPELRSIDKIDIVQSDKTVPMAIKTDSNIAFVDSSIPYIFQLKNETDIYGNSTININLNIK